MGRMALTPNVVAATNVPELPDQLERLQSQLSLCEKALAEYLETKGGVLNFVIFFILTTNIKY